MSIFSPSPDMIAGLKAYMSKYDSTTSSNTTTSNPKYTAIILDPIRDTNLIPAFVDIHIACVLQDNLIATFRPPFDAAKRELMIKWWHARFDEASRDERVIIAVLGKLRDADAMPPPSKLAPDQQYETRAIMTNSGEAVNHEEVLAGYVTLHKPITETGPFRGPIEKLLVNPRFRFRGIARTMMRRAEVVGREHGRTLLVSHIDHLSNHSTGELLRYVAVVLMHLTDIGYHDR